MWENKIMTNELKGLIDLAYANASNAKQFKTLVSAYTGLTNIGISKCDYCQELIASFNKG